MKKRIFILKFVVIVSMALGISGAVYAIPCSVGEFVYGNPAPDTNYTCMSGSGNDWNTINSTSVFFSLTDWAHLEKNDTPGSVDVADFEVGLVVNPDANVYNGTWSFTNTPWDSYSDIMIVLKGGNGFSAHKVLFDHTSGAWNTGGDPALSHMSVYGRVGEGGNGDNGDHPIPEPSTMLLLGLGLTGLVGFRRKLKS